MIRIDKFVFNLFAENTYVVWDDISKDCLVIDPGCSNKSEEQAIDALIFENELKVKFLINTHCHIDHILGNAFIKNKYNPEFLASEEDVFLLEMIHYQSMSFGMDINHSPLPDRYLKEDLSFNLSGSSIKFLFTPGHSPGGYCLYFQDENFCITGDVLFRESIGRTDLWGGDFDTLMNSIKSKLLSLPDQVVIYPGHSESSTIGYEKAHNPFLV